MATNTYTDKASNRLYEWGKPKKLGKPKPKPPTLPTTAELRQGLGGTMPDNPFGSPISYGPGTGALTPSDLVNSYNSMQNRDAYAYGGGSNSGYGGGFGSSSESGGGSSSGSGSGGGGTGSYTGDKWTGNAGDYAPGGMDIIYDRPELLVRDQLKKMGFNTDAGIMDLIGQDAGDLQYLAMLGMGAQPDSLNSQTDESYINFGTDWAKNMATPGGSAPDTMAMLQSILDAPGGSALKSALANGTPQEQAQMLNNLVSVAAGGLTPLMQRALMGSMEGRTTDWLSSQAKGGKGGLADWLQKGGQGYLG